MSVSVCLKLSNSDQRTKPMKGSEMGKGRGPRGFKIGFGQHLTVATMGLIMNRLTY